MRQPEDRIPPTLTLCRGCEQYVQPGTITCPFCGGDVGALMKAYERREMKIAAAAAQLRAVLAGLEEAGAAQQAPSRR